MSRPYVMTWSGGAGDDHRLELFGPFESEDDAGCWGDAWQAANGDDPMWQVVMLASTVTPDATEGHWNSYTIPVSRPATFSAITSAQAA